MPLLHLLKQNPVIAAVKDNASLQLAIDSECQFISVLYGNICTISNIVKKIKNAGKYAFIHVDLLEGASNKEIVIQFLKLVTEADGIISTKAPMLPPRCRHPAPADDLIYQSDVPHHNRHSSLARGYSQPPSRDVAPAPRCRQH